MEPYQKQSRASRPRNKKMNEEFTALSKKAGPHEDKVGKHAPRHRAGRLSRKEIDDILEDEEDFEDF